MRGALWGPLLFLAACGGNVVVDGSGAAGASGTGSSGGASSVSSCVKRCGDEFPDGKESFDVVSVECACMGCSDGCSTAVCTDKELPSNACLPCVVAAIRGDACMLHAGLFSHCFQAHDSCNDFIVCLEAC